ncbi:Fic family protein [Stenotrophomonas maltophilia]|uniref:Fic family protein n=1 Tax=Stenotrophomonas geniculata TaxID=86188 RepID=UPI0018D391A8|nr:Fic family protein [Stenotrophomonas maltophilia]
MKVRYGLPESSIDGLQDCKFALPGNAPDHCSSRRLRELFARVLSCRMRFCPSCRSADDHFLRCRRGAEYLKSAGKCNILNMHARSLLFIHARFSSGAVERAGFRVGRIWVGPRDAPQSFVAAHIDVQSHLSRIIGATEKMAPIVRLYALLLTVNIIHPFEDGNGRLMRAIAFVFSIHYHCDFFAFLAIYIKVMQREFVHAIELAADGAPSALEEFNCAALELFERLRVNPGGLEEWGRGVLLGRILAEA